MLIRSLFVLPLLMYSLNAGDYAVCEQVRQDDEIAQHLIEAILEKEPHNTQCVLQLANIHLKKGRVTEGFGLVTRAYEINPHAVKQNAVSKVLPSALKVTQLIAQAKKGNDKSAWSRVGEIFFEIGIFKEASLAYEASLKIDEGQIKERLMFALALQNSGQTYRAAEEFKKIITLSEGHFFAHYYLGKLLKHQIYDEKAAQYYLGKAQEVLNKSQHLFPIQEFALLDQDLKKELLVPN